VIRRRGKQRDKGNTADAILRAHGLANLTRTEQHAHAGMLDRMGAFAPAERVELIRGGVLNGWTAASVAGVLGMRDEPERRRKP
jgi:hypothetical protein